MFISLKISEYRNYFFGSFISETGNQMQIVAVSWQVYEMTRNPASLGLIGVANFLPILFFSLFGGLAADKIDRKKILIISQLASSALAILLFLATFTQLINPWIIYLILFLSQIAGSFSLPARHAILPNLVPKKYFMNAVSLNTLQFQSSMMLGPAIAGFLIAGLGVGSIYLFNSFSYVIFILALLTIKIPLHTERKEIPFSYASIMDGLRFVFKTPILYTTMMLDFLATFFGTATILMPVFAKDILHVGSTGLGFLYAAPAIGGVVAAISLSLISRIKNQGRVIVAAVLIYGFATIGFGFSRILMLSLFFLMLSGFGDMVSVIMRNTIRQMVTPDHLRGRMASIMRIFFQGGPQLGEIEAGFLAKAIGGPASVVAGGIGTVAITALIIWKNKSLRNYTLDKS